MGILNVSPLEWVTRVMDFSQTSLDNTLDTVKEVHQTMAEIPINVAQEFGMSEEISAALKHTHRRVLEHTYNGVSDAVGEVNQYMVKQAQNVDKLTNFARPPAKPKIVKLASKKEPLEKRKTK
jgi:methyl-accepting chemotaxis protein